MSNEIDWDRILEDADLPEDLKEKVKQLNQTDVIILYIIARHGTPITQSKIEAIYTHYKKLGGEEG